MEAEAPPNRCYQRTSLYGVIPEITAIFNSTLSLNVANGRRVMCVRNWTMEMKEELWRKQQGFNSREVR